MCFTKCDLLIAVYQIIQLKQQMWKWPEKILKIHINPYNANLID